MVSQQTKIGALEKSVLRVHGGLVKRAILDSSICWVGAERNLLFNVRYIESIEGFRTHMTIGAVENVMTFARLSDGFDGGNYSRHRKLRELSRQVRTIRLSLALTWHSYYACSNRRITVFVCQTRLLLRLNQKWLESKLKESTWLTLIQNVSQENANKQN